MRGACSTFASCAVARRAPIATVQATGTTVNAGTVTFAVYREATLIGSAVTSGTVSNGAASSSYTLPAGTPAGTYTIEATYNSGGDFSGSSDNTHTLTVNAASAALISPTSGSLLGGPTQFTWNPGAGASMFALWIGTTQGSYNLYTTGHVANTVTSATFNVPANGATLYVRLWYELNGNWDYTDYTFTEDVAPALTSPTSSPLGGPTQFTWNPGTGSTMFALWIGTTPGTHDVYTTGHVANTVTSETV